MKYILDIDGTLLDGKTGINDSPLFIQNLQKQGTEFLLATNSIKPAAAQKERLDQAGISVEISQIFTPAAAVNAYIHEQGINRVYVVGSPLEIEQIQAEQHRDPQLVILMDFEKNNAAYQDLQFIFGLLNQGCPAVSASGSPFYMKNGSRQLDTGSFKALLEAALSREIPVLGKPSEMYFTLAARCLKAHPGEVLVAGDDWKTDIQGAKDAGMNAVLLQSGKYQPGDETKCKPDSVVRSLLDIQ